MRYIVLLLTCLPCWAQFPYSGASWSLKSGSFTPPSIPHLAYWWVASDITNNTTVTNWIDRIQGAIWTNGVAARQPTNSSVGVAFSGTSHLLTNTAPYTFNLTNDSLLILTRRNATGATFQDLIVDGSTERGPVIQTPSTKQFFIRNTAAGGRCEAPAVNAYWDYSLTFDVGAQKYTDWSNAVSIAASIYTAANPNTFLMLELGNDLSNIGSDQYSGSFQEILVYTNTHLVLSDVQNLHKYFTNTYTFSP